MDRLTEILGCRHPVLQGAMSFVSNPELVAAVSEAGGFGVLASAPLSDPETLVAQIRATRELTEEPFGVNLVGFNPRTMAMAHAAVDMGIDAVTVSAGFSASVVGFLKNHGVTVMQVVANVTHALKAEAAGVDAIIAEGCESGGAQGTGGVSTLVLVPQVVDAVEVPVVAAGGIADRRGFLAVLALGASGIQMGSRFLASRECIAHARCKEILCRADDQATTLIPMGRSNVRVVRTPVVGRYLANPDPAELDRLMSVSGQVLLEGRTDLGPMASGQVIGMIHEIKSVRQIIEEIMAIPRGAPTAVADTTD